MAFPRGDTGPRKLFSKYRILLALILALAVTFPVSIFTGSVAEASGSATVTVEVEDTGGNAVTEVGVGDEFQVSVYIDIGSDQTYGMQYKLSWDEDMVSYVEPAEAGDFYGSYSNL